MKAAPLTKLRPTNSDIVDQLNTVHHCLDEHKKTTKQEFRKFCDRLATLEERGTTITDKVDAMAFALGTSAEAKSTVATMTPWRMYLQTVAAFGSTLGGVFLVLKLFAVVWPALKLAFLAVAKYIIG